MSHITYLNDNLLRYTIIKYIESDLQVTREFMKEIKPQLTKKAYRKLKHWSGKEELATVFGQLSRSSSEKINTYYKKLNSEALQKEIEQVNEKMKKTRKMYMELQALETKFSDYSFKEKYGKKTSEVKQIIWEIQKKKDELRALCGTTRPFTETGRENTKNPKEAVSFGNIVIEPESVKLIPKEDIWVKLHDKYYKKEMAAYSKNVTKNRFTKITDEALQGTLLATCINNENPKLIPLEEEFALMAHIYQYLYDTCLKIDKDFVSTPEVRSKIQNHIMDHLNERLIGYSTSRDRLGSLIRLHHSIPRYDDERYWDAYINDLRKFVSNEKFVYTKLKNTTSNVLKEYEKQLKPETNELKQQLTPVAYSKFKENFPGFVDLIQQVKKHPYQDLKTFSNDIQAKNEDLLKAKIEQINTYRDETVRLYCKKKTLEKEMYSCAKGSEEYNLLTNKKIQVEKSLEAFCGTTSPFTETGKKMIYFRSKNEDLSIISRANNKQSLEDRLNTARKDSENKRVNTKRREPEHNISHA